MRGNLRRRCMTSFLLVLVSGCTIAELHREERSDEARVRQKEADLQTEQARTNELNRQKEQLTADLTQRQLSLTELTDRVDRIQKANARESTSNDAARLERQRLSLERQRLIAKVQQTSAQLAAAQQSTDGSSAEKQRRIEYLKSQIDTQLELLLH
jgi:septal ring factor EnvC (AmiA/AmiB activator)